MTLANLTKETKEERQRRLQNGFKPRPSIIPLKTKKINRKRKHKKREFFE